MSTFPFDGIRLCNGEEVVLAAKDEEFYERFEWYKDGQLIQDATTSTFFVNSDGEFEVRVYNRKNCPSVSNSVKVYYPAYPSGIIQNPIVGFIPGQPVDVTASISGYDSDKYDYQLWVWEKSGSMMRGRAFRRLETMNSELMKRIWSVIQSLLNWR